MKGFTTLLVFSVAAGAVGYDYVVVGGGVAGSVVATRLAATHSVLLLNIAGPPPTKYNAPVMTSDELIVKNNLSATPGMLTRIHQPGYNPVPQFSTSETGSSPARYLGGSSIVGLSLFLYDLDKDWAPGWDWNIMQNYMLRSDIQPTHSPAYLHPLTKDFLKAVPEAKPTPLSQRPDGTKISAYAAYIVNKNPRRLTILENVRADRLIIEGGVCRGVYVRDLARGGHRSIIAKNEVIVSAGYLFTPRLLFLSGIGDAKDLANANIEVVQDLPLVGKNLTAPRFTPISWHTKTPTLSQMMGSPISKAQHPAVPEAFQSAVAEATVPLRKGSIAQFMPLYYSPSSAPLQYSLQGEPWPLETNAFTVLVTMTTEAKGEIKFDRNPDVSPTITHAPLTASDEQRGDEAIRAAEQLGRRLPSEGRVKHTQDWSAVYDGRGTCRMGSDPRTSVVDTMLRVHGVRNLRIVDGSALPSDTPYLAMPEVLMLAERAVDLIVDVATYAVKDLPLATPLLAAVSGERETFPNMTMAGERERSSNMATAISPWMVAVFAATGIFFLLTGSFVATFVNDRKTQAEADVYVQA